MSKKKPQPASENQEMPTVEATTDGRKKSRHKQRKMIAIPDRMYELLSQLAKKEKRPVAWQARIAIMRDIVEAGLIDQKEADTMLDDDGGI